MNLITFDLETFTMDKFRFIKIHTWIGSLGHKQQQQQQQQQQQISLKLADEKEISLLYKPQSQARILIVTYLWSINEPGGGSQKPFYFNQEQSRPQILKNIRPVFKVVVKKPAVFNQMTNVLLALLPGVIKMEI